MSTWGSTSMRILGTIGVCSAARWSVANFVNGADFG
jgi:hypothetical protein